MSIIDGDSLVYWSSFLHTSTCQLIMLRLFSRGNNFTFVEFERNWYKHSTLWTDDKKNESRTHAQSVYANKHVKHVKS